MSSSHFDRMIPIVELHGSILASAYNSTLHSSGDEEGLLFGSVHREIQECNTDSGIAQQKTVYIVRVEQVKICPQHQPFYDNNGQIDESVLQAVCGDSNLELVGWCRFRQNSPFMTSMWERIILRSLRDKISNLSAQSDALFGLFISSRNRSSTTILRHTFFHLQPGSTSEMCPVSLNVLNVGETNTKYKRPHITSRTLTYQTCVDSHSSEFLNDHGDFELHRRVRNLSLNLLTTLQERTSEIALQESQLQVCRDEIAELRQTLLNKISSNDDSATTRITQSYSEPSSELTSNPISSTSGEARSIDASSADLLSDRLDLTSASEINLIDLENSLEDLKVPEPQSDENVHSTVNQIDMVSQGLSDKDSLEGSFHDHSFECIDISEAQASGKPQEEVAFSFVKEYMNDSVPNPSFSPVRTPVNHTQTVKPATS